MRPTLKPDRPESNVFILRARGVLVTLAVALLGVGAALAAPPPNDQCDGAEVIPGAGPFPYLTAVTSDITDATTTGDAQSPPCAGTVSRSVWYRFAPTVSAQYVISSCADAPTATTVNDTVIDIVSNATGACSGFTTTPVMCDDNGCTFETAQATVTATLNAGTTYFILVHMRGTSPPSAGDTAVQLRVTQNIPPANDLCAGALPLSLGVPVIGSTLLAVDDYHAPGTTACFAGISQTATDAPGPDVVYAFTAAAAGGYAFRTTRMSGLLGDPVLYVADACPSGPSPQTVSCLLGSNRGGGALAEDVACVTVAAGQTVYVIVDDRQSGFPGAAYRLEAEPCVKESEPNDTPTTAGPLACGLRGGLPNGDPMDYYVIADVPVGGRIFALADGAAEDHGEYDLRVTTMSDTLEYDNNDNDPANGDNSANIAGTPAPSADVRLQVTTMAPESEPYRLDWAVQPPATGAMPEVEPNNTPATATAAEENYFSGALAPPGPSTDVDCYSFTAAAGDAVYAGLDEDPERDETSVDARLDLLDASGATLATVDDQDSQSDNSTSPGDLQANRPRFPAEALRYRISTAGTYSICVRLGAAPAPLSVTGNYLLSIARNCAIGSHAELSVAIAGAPDPVPASTSVTYTIDLTNAGPDAAHDVLLAFEPPPEIAIGTLSLTGPAGWNCVPGGAGDARPRCTNPAFDPGQMAEFAVEVPVDACAPTGSFVSAGATAASPTPDRNAADDLDAASTQVADPPGPDTDNDGIKDICDADDDNDGQPDVSDCAPLDGSIWNPPSQVIGLMMSPDQSGMAWELPPPLSGQGNLHDVVRGPLPGPVGSSPLEVCLTPGGVAGSTASDPSLPAVGQGYWYLVRRRNVCAAGTYGTTSTGVQRVTSACP